MNPASTTFREIGRVPLSVYESEFARVNSPLLPYVRSIHAAAGAHSALILAQMWLENQYATTGILIRPSDNNPLSLRPPSHGVAIGRVFPDIVAPDGGRFLRFTSPDLCILEWHRRIFEDPDYAGGRYQTAITLEEFLAVYAPSGDVHPVTGLDNANSNYLESVQNSLNKFAALEAAQSPEIPGEEETAMAFNIGNRPIRIAVGTGHANASGGNAFETAINKKVVNELLKLVRNSKGFEVRCWTPGDGLLNHPGALDTAAATVRTWVAQGWGPDIVTEVHQEGLGNSAVRGAFVIYPDSRGLSGRKAAGDYTDIDVREAAGGMAQILARETGMAVRYNPPRGMSERETGVGGDGFRLGFFGAVSDPYFAANSCVFISEGGAYTNPTELRIMQQPDFPRKQAVALLKMYAYLAESRGNWTYPYQIGSVPVPKPQPTPAYAPAKKIDALAKYAKATAVPAYVGADHVAYYYINATVKSTEALKRLQGPQADGPVIGPEVPANTEFYIPWAFQGPDGKMYGYSYWGTHFELAKVQVID